MKLLKHMFVYAVSIVSVTFSSVCISQISYVGNDTASVDKIVDDFLNSLLNTYSIDRSYYEHYDISPDGNYVAFSITRPFLEDDVYQLGSVRYLPGGLPSTFARHDIWIANTETGETRHITSGKERKASYWHPVWSPDGNDLAFFGFEDGLLSLYICRNANQKYSEVKKINNLFLKGSLFRYDRPIWSNDGTRIIVPVLPESDKDREIGVYDNPLYIIPSIYKTLLNPEEGGIVNVIRSSDEAELSRFIKNERRVDLGIVGVVSGTYQKLTDGLDVYDWALSPDGQLLSFKVIKDILPGTYDFISDLYVIPLNGGSYRRISENIESGILWSPDSKMLLERSKGRLITVNVSSGENIVVTPKDSSFKAVYPIDELLLASVNTYLWTPAGEEIIARNEDGWWLLALNNGPPRKIFNTLDTPVTGIVRSVKEGWAFSPDGENILVESNISSKGKNLLIKTGFKTDGTAQIISNTPNYANIYDLIKKDTISYILYMFSEENISNLWFSDLNFNHPLKLTDLNRHLKTMSQAEKKLFTYRSTDGEMLSGALLLPLNYEEGKCCPLIVDVYAGSIVNSIEREFLLGFSPVRSLSLLFSRCGYAVLHPSIPLPNEGTKGDPLKNIPKSVLPAIDRVIEMGIADSERIGVIGQSYGGYTVNVLITQSKQFKAAVSMAGFCNLITLYGAFDARFRYGVGGAAIGSHYFEAGQGRMGVPLWEDRMEWIENSPIFYLDKVHTPLLLIHGDLDFVGIQQAEEMFSGLKRLGKEAEFARYFGEGHVLSKPSNIQDSWHRIIEWFNRHLK